MSVQDMADYLGVSRNSVGNWIGDRHPPSLPILRLWSLRTDTDFDWLMTGAGSDTDEQPPPTRPPGGRSSGTGPIPFRAPRGDNHHFLTTAAA